MNSLDQIVFNAEIKKFAIAMDETGKRIVYKKMRASLL